MNTLSTKYKYFYGENNAEKMPHKQDNRCFPFVVAVHVNSGQYICKYNNEKLIAATGETLIVPEYILHHIQMENKGLLSWAHFSAHFGNNDILGNYDAPFIITKEFSVQLRKYIESINDSDADCLGTLNRDLNISALFIDILSNYAMSSFSADNAWIVNLKKHITKNITQKFNLSELAAYCHMSESSFSHKFKNNVGVSPMKYIICQKINTSLSLLDSGEKLASVSQKLNFSNEYHYSKQFKSVTGMTPSDYRKNKIIP